MIIWLYSDDNKSTCDDVVDDDIDDDDYIQCIV